MSKYLLSGLLGLVIGTGIGTVVTILVYPFVFPPPEVNEQIADIGAKTVIASGHFIHPNPSDPVHWGKGGVSIYQQGALVEIFLHGDFEVGPGPAYHVYLSTGSDIRSNDDFNSSMNTDLGKLKSFKSSQIYKGPDDIVLEQFNSVVVWCETFNQLISAATLKPVN